MSADRSTAASHWQAPVTAGSTLDNSAQRQGDGHSRFAAPTTAYAVWDRLKSPSQREPGRVQPQPAFRGRRCFRRRPTAATTWSNGRVIFDPGQNNQTIGNQMWCRRPDRPRAADRRVRPDPQQGRQGQPRSTFSAAIIRSADGGSSWSSPTIVDTQQLAQVFIDGEYIRTSDELPEFTAGPNGNLYAAGRMGVSARAATRRSRSRCQVTVARAHDADDQG